MSLYNIVRKCKVLETNLKSEEIMNFYQIFFIYLSTFIVIMSTPLGGGYIIFAFSAVRHPMSGVRCPASRMVSAHLKEKY